MQYLTFEEYSKIGGTLDVTAFDRYSVRAFSRIKQETQGRVDKMGLVPDEIKHLCRDLIEYMYNNVTTDRAIASASQSQGGASESESYVNKTCKDIEEEIGNLIYDYLASVTNDAGIPLLYRGCCDVK